MTTVIQKDCRFLSGQKTVRPHEPTKGISLLQTTEKICKWAAFKSYDLLFTGALSGENLYDPNSRLLDAVQKRAKLFSQDVIQVFIQYLRIQYPGTSIHFLSEGLGVNKKIKGVDPLSVIAKVQKNDVEEEDWMVVARYSGTSQSSDKRFIVYPFVYPANGWLGMPHVVLILVDQEKQTIYYYDSNGLTSDDPRWQGIFSDQPEFNMHANLVDLAKVLFPDQTSKLVENIMAHQIDPVNCGTHVCRVVRNLYAGMTPVKAIEFNPDFDSPLAFKQTLHKEFQKHRDLARREEIEKLKI